MDQQLRARLFDSFVLPALCYAAETGLDTVATSKGLRATLRALEGRRLKYEINVSFRDPEEYVSKEKSMVWSFIEKNTRQMNTENCGMDLSYRKCPQKGGHRTHGLTVCWKDELAEFSAGNHSQIWTSQKSPPQFNTIE
ncbi:unnamed protein product [Strongylus vulgaris]|uniref:Uncharacterized protein n=1 Tax=Strongylus vulgaris TaxID=40348 RepID=A0A3P7IWI8_STRVU|nr:unnamed protein product [Strongylus vulgaris]